MRSLLLRFLILIIYMCQNSSATSRKTSTTLGNYFIYIYGWHIHNIYKNITHRFKEGGHDQKYKMEKLHVLGGWRELPNWGRWNSTGPNHWVVSMVVVVVVVVVVEAGLLGT